MHYNLLNYGYNTSWCTQSNNNIDDKTSYLKKIINYAKPDIFTVNELNCDNTTAQHVLDNALNVNGIQKYRITDVNCTSLPGLANSLFYNHDKVRFHSVKNLGTDVRDINIYRMYYYSNELANGDTAFLYCCVAHLKAGSDASDKAERAEETQILMDYLNTKSYSNVILCGDLNIQSSNETSFQTLINHSNESIRFFDPVDQAGTWHNNESFAAYHTQSTHTANSCASGGGMDDRFDFILVSKGIKNSTSDYTYITDSYETIGQDGQHYNIAINDSPPNTSVSSDVLEALANVSDHLPVCLRLRINKTLSIKEEFDTKFNIHFANPVSDKLRISISTDGKYYNGHIEIYNLPGEKLFEKTDLFFNSGSEIEIPVNFLKRGIYILNIKIDGLGIISKKFIKN